MYQTISIDKNVIQISRAYPIKQFVVRNPTSFPVVVKTSTDVPSVDRYDFYIQPKSSFTSPVINSSNLTFFTPNLDLKSNNPTVDIHDSPDLTSANIVYNVEQVGTSNFPNYPYSFIAPSASQVSLPAIKIESFRRLVFVFTSSLPNGQSEPLLFFVGDEIKAVNRAGTVGFTPKEIPSTITPIIEYYSLFSTVHTVTVNVFLSDYELSDIQIPRITQGNFGTGLTKTFTAMVKPGPVYYSLVALPATSFAFNVTVTVSLIRAYLDLGTDYTVTYENFPYVDAASANPRTLLSPRYLLAADYGLIKMTLTNLSGAGNSMSAFPVIKMPL